MIVFHLEGDKDKMPASKREKTSQKKRDKIIQTTMRLLLKKGNLTSTTDICTAAKLTRPTLYHYFGSKRNLLLSVHMEGIERDLKPYIAEALSINDPLKRLIVYGAHPHENYLSSSRIEGPYP